MICKKLKTRFFRNLIETEINPCESINIIYGENGQGKTNILEAMWLFCGLKSFRGAKDSEMLFFESEWFQNELDFFAEDRNQTAKIRFVDGKRETTLNGIKKTTAARQQNSFSAVAFAPQHMSIVKDGPSVRRRFLDTALSGLSGEYYTQLSEYSKGLAQRNSLLKDYRLAPALYDHIFMWDEILAKHAAAITIMRMNYIDKLTEKSAGFYSGISSGKEKMKLTFHSSGIDISQGMTQKELYEEYKRRFSEMASEDIRLRTTTVGPHRDDFLIYIDDREAKLFASQGQQRSCALSLKLSEGELLSQKLSEHPVILLDDVLSELDDKRQKYVLNSLSGRQVFITCCDPGSVTRLTGGKVFSLKDGKIE